MPPVPDNPKSWEEHLLKVCSKRLSLALAKEREEFEVEISKRFLNEHLRHLRPKMIGQLESLSELLNNPDVPPRKQSYQLNVFLKFFRQDISEQIREKLHWHDNNLFMDGSC